ncbi:MAG: hypothetical protein Q7U71_05340 [bacterium]|nr:hypothetical protein [bacterium]
MVRKLLWLLLLASPLSAQTVTDIYIREVKNTDNSEIKSKKNYYSEVVIVYEDNNSYLLFSEGYSVVIAASGFRWSENGETIVKKYGIESISTIVSNNGICEIKINTTTIPSFSDYISGNNVIIRLAVKSEPKIYYLNIPNKEVNTFPVSLSFRCEDVGRKDTDTIEYRAFIKAPDEMPTVCGYSVGQWTPWAQGDSGSVVFDSLIYPGKYSVKVQARNKNTGVESKKIETKFKYKK